MTREWLEHGTLFTEHFLPVMGSIYLTTVCCVSHTDNSTQKWHFFFNCPTHYFQLSVRRRREYVVKTISLTAVIATEYYFNYIVIYCPWNAVSVISCKLKGTFILLTKVRYATSLLYFGQTQKYYTHTQIYLIYKFIFVRTFIVVMYYPVPNPNHHN